MAASTSEDRLIAATEAARKDEAARSKSYGKQVKAMREANADGVSYDRIAKITGLSKTQVQRICGA